jgi:hypothetical protein
MKSIIAATVVTFGLISSVDAASLCKGLDQPTCESQKIGDVSLCRWQAEYYTTGGIRGNFCTTSNRKLTKEQYEQLQQQQTATAAPTTAN